MGPAFKKGLQEGRQGGVGEGEATLLRRQSEAFLVTRNVKDFAGFGVPILNPWVAAV